jgi:TonB family protein
MSKTHQPVANPLPLFDRRVHSRVPVRSVAYVALDEGNGGIILNIGEGGMSVQAVVGLVDDLLPCVRLQSSKSQDWAELAARVAWRDKSRRVVGLQFTDLPNHTRNQIREWVSHEPVLTDQRLIGVAGAALQEPPAVARPSGATVHQMRAPSKPAAFSEFPSERILSPIEGSAAPTIASDTVATRAPDSLTFGRTLSYPRSPRANWESPLRQKETQRGRRRGSRATLAALVMVLVLGSLAAGWEAGRGALGEVFGRIDHLQWPRRAATEEALPRLANLAPVAPEIERLGPPRPAAEVVAVPPINPSGIVARRPAQGNLILPAHKASKVVASWISSPPVRKQRNPGTEEAVGDNALVAESALTTQHPDSLLSGPPNIRPPTPPAQATVLHPGNLIHRVDPDYPIFAKEHGIEGSVEMKVTVGPDGAVRQIEPISGQGILMEAAIAAVRKWRYTPTLLDTKPSESVVHVKLQFQLPHSN